MAKVKISNAAHMTLGYTYSDFPNPMLTHKGRKHFISFKCFVSNHDEFFSVGFFRGPGKYQKFEGSVALIGRITGSLEQYSKWNLAGRKK